MRAIGAARARGDLFLTATPTLTLPHREGGPINRGCAAVPPPSVGGGQGEGDFN